MILESFLLAVGLTLAPLPPRTLASPSPSLHDPFSALLLEHVQNDLVDYDGFARAPGFPSYLEALAAARPDSMPRADQLAFWSNVYNAYTIQLINRHQERESIRNINKFLGMVSGKGPWKENIVRAGGRTLNLDQVEHQIIRPLFKEPRIHMALVCAARSCPPLRLEAYEGSRLEAQLQDQTRTFLRERPAVNRLDSANAVLHLSPIFDWYREDFGKTDGAILKFVARYFEGEAERPVFEGSGPKIRFTDYDWSLNIQKPRPTP